MTGQASARQEAFNAHFGKWRAEILIDRVDILIGEGLTAATTGVIFA
jgi:hypothetical protein